jgi:hypothetical protein
MYPSAAMLPAPCAPRGEIVQEVSQLLVTPDARLDERVEEPQVDGPKLVRFEG